MRIREGREPEEYFEVGLYRYQQTDDFINHIGNKPKDLRQQTDDIPD